MKNLQRHSTRSLRPWVEPLEQRMLLTASIVSGFDSTGPNGWTPPDTFGAVGPSHVVSMINDYFQVYNKTTHASLLAESANTFWANAGIAGVTAFDSRIIYDPLTQRWFASSDVDAGKSNSRLLVGISKTSDPTGAWKGFAFQSNTAGNWGDYPTLGLDANGVYLAANIFSVGGNVYQNSAIYAINKSAFLNFVNDTTGNVTSPAVATWASGYNGTLLPATDCNPAKAATAPEYIVSRYGGNVNLRAITWNGATPTLAASSSAIGIPNAASSPTNPTQPSGATLDAGDGRLLSALVTNSSGTLWTVVPTTLSGHSGGVFAQINLSNKTLTQSGNLTDASADILYPSIAANDNGDAVLGFTKVSSTMYASVYATGRLGTDAPGTLETQVLIKAGTGSYGGTRWGDYSATVVDPSDVTKFWTYQEYATSGSWGTYWSQLSLATLPAAPSNFAATGTSQSSIRLTWNDNADNESGYLLERSTDSGQTWNAITTTAPNVKLFDDTGLQANTTYSYRLTAVNNYGNSASVTTSGTTQGVTAPAAPSNLVAKAASGTQINLTWTDNATNETGYYVYRSTDGTNFGQLAVNLAAGATSYSDSGLSVGATYWYYVVAYNGAGPSGPSNTASTATLTTPAAPSSLVANGVSRGVIQLSWQDNAGNESGFYIERSTTGTSGWTQIASVGANVTSYKDGGLRRGATYFYRVRAYNGAGTSAYSNIASAVAPTKLDAKFYPEGDVPEYIAAVDAATIGLVQVTP